MRNDSSKYSASPKISSPEAIKFKILPHKADLKIQIWGSTKKELFSNALLGMEASLRPEILNPKSKIRKIKIKSFDLNSLSVDFLSEVLYLNQVNKEIYNKVKFKKFSDTPHQNKFGTGQAELEAEISGQKTERFGEDIKAVTHHGLDIRQNENGIWEATILFDI